MATYNPYNKAIKESINVDFRDRHSPQKVILCNRENQFYGEFIGTAKINNINIIGGKLTDVELSNVSIYDSDGNILELSKIGDRLTEFENTLDVLSNAAIPALCIEISGNTANIHKLSATMESVFAFEDEINTRLTAEAFLREQADKCIANKLSDEVARLEGVDTKISSKLDEHIHQYGKDLPKLSSDLIDEFNLLKHYSLTTVKLTNPGYYQLNDYSSNFINDQVPYGYVSMKETDGSVEPVRVGKIIDVEFDGADVSKFTLVVFEGCTFVELKPGDYRFTTTNRTIPTGFRNYELYWSASPSSEDKFEMVLVGSVPSEYLLTEFTDPVIGKPQSVGKVFDFAFDKTGENISCGSVKFIPTADTPSITSFTDDVFMFSDTPENTISDYTATDKKPARRIIFDKDNQKFILRDNYCVKWYQSIKQDTFEFGRIYDDAVVYDDDKSLQQMDVRLSIIDDDAKYKINRTVTLTKDNGFKQYLDDNFNYLAYIDNRIVLNRDCIIRAATLNAFNNSTGTVGERVVGEIKIDTENLSDFSDIRISSFTITLSGVAEISDGSYTLRQSHVVDSENIYEYTAKDDSGGLITFRYDSNYERNLIKFVKKTDKTVIGYFYINIDTLRIIKNDETKYYSSDTLLKEDDKLIFPEEDALDTKTYDVNYLTADIYKTQGDDTFTLNSTIGNPTIRIQIPSIVELGRLREFIAVLKLKNPYAPTPTKVQFVCDKPIDGRPNEYQFFLDGVDLLRNEESSSIDSLDVFDSKLRLTKPTSVYRFVEVDYNKFMVEDMNNTALIDYINERLRGGVNYRGVVQVVNFEKDGSEITTDALSNLFYRNSESELVKSGEWKFPRPEYVNPDIQLFNGNMFFVGKSKSTTTTRWTIQGLELEYGDYIIINKDGVKISEITSSDIDVIDTIEKDHIIVEDITVTNLADINKLSVTYVSADNIDVKKGVITNLTSTNDVISNLTATNEEVDNLTAVDVKISSEVVLSSNISNLNATDEEVSNLTVTDANISSETVLSSNISDLTVTNEDVSDLTATNVNISSETVLSSDISDLTVIYEKVSNLTATNANISSEIVVSSYIENLTATNEEVSNLTVENANISSETVLSSSISDLMVIDGVVSNLTATNANISSETVLSSVISNLTADNEAVNNLTVINVDISSEVVISSDISNLSVTNEEVDNLTATDVKISSELVLTSDISDLTVTDEEVSNLTATNVNISSEKVLSSDISDLTASNAIISSEMVLTSNVSKLIVVDEEVNNLTAGTISVDLSALNFVNNSEVSSAAEISNKFQDEIDSINKRVYGHLNYKGDVQMVDEYPDAGLLTIQYLSNLFWLQLDDISKVEGWNFPNNDCSSYNHELSIGELFYIGKSKNTKTTRWTLSGGENTVELEEGDYIFIKRGPVKIQDITVDDIHVIDSIEKDLIIVEDISVSNKADINTAKIGKLSVDTLSVNTLETIIADISVANISSANITYNVVSNLTATNVEVSSETVLSSNISNLMVIDEVVSNLTVINEEVDNLTAIDVKVSSEVVLSSDISDLMVTDEVVSNLTATNVSISSETVLTSDISNLNVTDEEVSNLTATNVNISSETVLSSNISDLMVTNEEVDNLTATNVNISSETVISSDISNLMIIDEVVQNLTATSANISSETVISSIISNLTAINEKVNNLTAINEEVSKLTVINANISSETVLSSDISDLTVTDEVVSNLTATNVEISSEMVLSGNISNLIATDVKVSSEVVLSSDISDLMVTDEIVSNLTAINANITSEVVVSSQISNLTATNEEVDNLTVETEIANSISATEISSSELTSEFAYINDEIVNNISASNISVDNIKFNKAVGTDVSVETAKISSLTVNLTHGTEISAEKLSGGVAIIDELSSTNISATNLTGESVIGNDISGGNISVALDKLYLKNGTEVSSAAEISSNMLKRIEANDVAISTLSDNLEELSVKHETLSTRYETTFLSTYAEEDDWTSRIPDKLILRDISATNSYYQLVVVNGRLSIRQIRFDDGSIHVYTAK